MELDTFRELIINLGNQYGYLLIFFASIGEGVGLPVPDGLILIVSGYFVNQGAMSLPGLIIFFLLGNLTGNLIAYTVGYWGKDWVKRIKFLKKRRQKAVQKAEELFADYGSWALLITQIFSRVLRIPMIYGAGAQKMNLAKYLLLCLVGNLVWGIFWSFIGLYITANWSRLPALLDNYKNVQIVIGLLLILGVFILYKKKSKGQKT
ncbi:DedA family protein [Fuchsiella alkaliacetigena]|uniref:DedA family protein n=1 Tax=Fuchsiella alkaliacetigena TaxID=957042 RepID=UPI00200ADA3B|nr:DedA family protein [Fuchsiella alkaliacetigena]MCK8824192.1 DedA family protein [Fuchsiella alkaliacetigena]